MTQTITPRQKCQFQIEHNGIIYTLGEMNSFHAMKQAHQFVRRWVMKEWLRTRMNNDTTAVLLANGQQFASVYGCHQNRAINSITL